MMPSLDHCINNPQEMTTLTNTLEVFDTYKHRDDKDSDEESFHLPLDDDEIDTKIQEPVRNGIDNETEDEILDKFDSTATFDHVDAQVEDSLLHDDDEQKKESKVEDGVDTVEKPPSPKIVENGDHPNEDLTENVCDQTLNNDKTAVVHGDSENISQQNSLDTEAEKDVTLDKNNVHNVSIDTKETIEGDPVKNQDVPKIDIAETNVTSNAEADSAIDSCDKSYAQLKVDDFQDTYKEDEEKEKLVTKECETTENISQEDSNEEENNKTVNTGVESEVDSPQAREDTSNDDKPIEKCENSNDSKHDNEDSEDLFDISIIRDAEEDNAENAYNEAHAEDNNLEDNEDDDDRTDEKMEEDVANEKANLLEEEEDEEMDIDKHDEHLKSDVDIEEAHLKLDCDGVKDTVSDGESDNSQKTELVVNKQTIRETVTSVVSSVTECRLDEVTGKLIGVDNVEVNIEDRVKVTTTKEVTEANEDAQAKKSLKRGLSDDDEKSTPKKSRTEEAADIEIREVEKPKEKLPLRTLLSLSDFMKTKKTNRRLTMHDLEEFCIQKMCEVIAHKSDLGDVHHQLKLQEQVIETMRKEIQQLTKQTRDLEIVNKKLLHDLKQQTATQKPLNPLKITRSVGLQVKFTPAYDASIKRRQANAAFTNQKSQTPTTPNRGSRVIPNTATTANRQVSSPQKQSQQLPKPNTPLLSQALQNRRSSSNDTNNKISNQVTRPKTTDQKTGAPSASVIDLTDEDDKKDKNKTSPQKMVSGKNIAVPLRTTPMRVNATAQGIRLTTSQGKVSPITSVVTSTSPQVMYVVHSSPQNVLTSPLGPKAVVVNLQSANGVLPQTINGSAVSVIPKQTNTIQLKTVSPPKALPNNKVVKMPNKHPAPLPAPPVVRINSDKPLKPIPPKPHLTIRKTDTGIILQWKMPYELDMYEVIASYQLYAYQETSALPSTDMWRKVGDVKALALPMACTLTQFADKNKYYFAVRPVDIHKRIGMFSEPEEISL